MPRILRFERYDPFSAGRQHDPARGAQADRRGNRRAVGDAAIDKPAAVDTRGENTPGLAVLASTAPSTGPDDKRTSSPVGMSNRGLLRMPVRGLAKVRSVVGLFVLAHHLLRTAALAPQLIGWGDIHPPWRRRPHERAR